MAGPTDSNDASDIFWPGYVDAISNLAINLLFVIAVMCIVILSFVLEGTAKSMPQPKASQATEQQDVQYVNESTLALAGELTRQIEAITSANAAGNPGTQAATESQAQVETAGTEQVTESPERAAGGLQSDNATDAATPGEPSKLQQAQVDLAGELTALQSDNEVLKKELKLAQEAIKAEQARLAQVKKEMSRQVKSVQSQNAVLREKLQQAQTPSPTEKKPATTPQPPSPANQATPSTAGQKTQNPATPTQAPRLEVMRATAEQIKEPQGNTSLESVAAGLIVQFDPKVVTLSGDEQKQMLERLAGFGAIRGTAWQITAITPKGFSESARLAYYRTVAVRNALIQAGVAPAQIKVRVLESAQEGADAARVTINAQP